jgi:peptidyl-prolyl cis-trans isomerase C
MSLSIDAFAPHVSDETAPSRVSIKLWGLFGRLSRVPFLQFLALGAVIFAVAHITQQRHIEAQRRIVVDEQVRGRIARTSQAQNGFTPGAAELERLVDDYVDDQVMYREALRMGLDQDDEIIRRRLIQKVQFLQHDLATVPNPTDNDLSAYYHVHPELFTAAARVTFEQLYFSADHGGWTEAERRARRALDQVRQGSASSSAPLDDPFPLQIPPGDLTRGDALRVFGDTSIVQALFSASEEQWSAPVRSAYGWHLIRVDRRQTGTLTPFAQVRAQVESAYLDEQTLAAQQREMAILRSRYDVVRLPGKSSSGS